MKILSSKLNLHPVLINAARDAMDAAADYSQLHPTCPLRDNPHVEASERALRAAFGSTSVVSICSFCGRCYPRVDDDVRSSCCGDPLTLDGPANVIRKLLVAR